MNAQGVWRPRIRVLIVDDQSLFRVGIAALLTSQPGISVVGTARDGLEAVDRVRTLLPNVVLMDVRMPRLDGITATARITSRYPSVRVVMLASLQTDESVVEAMRAGATGYVHKDAGREELVSAIFHAAEGREALGAEAQRAVVSTALGKTERKAPPDGLSRRQFQVLKLMAMGLALKQIAAELGLKEKTVRNQASLMYAKLRVKDRAQAILYALHKGIA
ncbi:MAG TPA: response regulator transcription factor [Candidatus Dormibacteraeota bacterium]|nr:response regulator transcription factor [Candidatus Dormibacteraeota bacterium]